MRTATTPVRGRCSTHRPWNKDGGAPRADWRRRCTHRQCTQRRCILPPQDGARRNARSHCSSTWKTDRMRGVRVSKSGSKEQKQRRRRRTARTERCQRRVRRRIPDATARVPPAHRCADEDGGHDERDRGRGRGQGWRGPGHCGIHGGRGRKEDHVHANGVREKDDGHGEQRSTRPWPWWHPGGARPRRIARPRQTADEAVARLHCRRRQGKGHDDGRNPCCRRIQICNFEQVAKRAVKLDWLMVVESVGKRFLLGRHVCVHWESPVPE